MKHRHRAIGIDLGTTNSVVAAIQNGRPIIIPNGEGHSLTPSVVAFAPDGACLVGRVAKNQALANPIKTISSIKRLIGVCGEVKIAGRSYTPQELSSYILNKVRSDAERYLNQPIDGAVVTVPAYFNDNQRQATKEACAIAGLEVIRIINEPTAAALAYGLDTQNIHTVLVWDLGGGTFDVSILELGDGVFEVKAVSGDTHLGGDDWDGRIIDFLAECCLKQHGLDPREDKVSLQRLWSAAEKAKVDLSTRTATIVSLGLLAQDGQSIPLEVSLTRSMFESLTSELLQKLVGPTNQALADAGLKAGEIDRVLLVGGSTRMPGVKRLAREVLGKEPYADINPDEVVAIGAAIQAGVLSGQVKDVVLVDVTPLSLGIEAQGGIFAKIIERNTTLPCSGSQVFTTADDNQTTVDINVLQGERGMAKENVSLGVFQFEAIPPGPRGEPRLEVAFNLDVNGIVNVLARELHTDTECCYTVKSPTKLSKLEIERIIAEAHKYAVQDEKEQEAARLPITAASLLDAVKEITGSAGHEASWFEEIDKATARVEAALNDGEHVALDVAVQDLRELMENINNEKPVRNSDLAG